MNGAEKSREAVAGDRLAREISLGLYEELDRRLGPEPSNKNWKCFAGELDLGENVMTVHEDWERILSTMSRGEKALLLQWIVRDLGDSFPGIESDPLVCGGESCIVRTRIPVWLLVQARNLGMSESDILRSYPTLRAEDLANAWGYYRTHREEIDREIRENEAA